MTDQTRTYFKHMYDVAFAYGRAAEERKAEKERLIAEDNWDAVHEWYEREKTYTSPYTSGQYKAFWAYRRSSEMELKDFEMSDALWESEVADFCRTLLEAGVTEFVLTNQTTALMENIHQLENQGWHLTGTCRLPVKQYRYGSDRVEEHLGLRFEIGQRA